jgi:hypothetical protein
MSTAFGVCSGAVGALMCMWFIDVGFLAKKTLREQQETNRILRHMGPAGSGLGSVCKTV